MLMEEFRSGCGLRINVLECGDLQIVEHACSHVYPRVHHPFVDLGGVLDCSLVEPLVVPVRTGT